MWLSSLSKSGEYFWGLWCHHYTPYGDSGVITTRLTRLINSDGIRECFSRIYNDTFIGILRVQIISNRIFFFRFVSLFLSHWRLTVASLLVLSEPMAFACLQAIVYTKVIPELEFTKKCHKYNREGFHWQTDCLFSRLDMSFWHFYSFQLTCALLHLVIQSV